MWRNLKEAFEGVVNAAVELKFISKDVKTSFKNELAIIGVNIDKPFEDKYLELDNKLNSIYKLPRIRADLEDPYPDSNLDQPGTQPKKLMKGYWTNPTLSK